MNDVIKLQATTYTTDAYGNEIPETVSRQVFCDVQSVTRSEWYDASQQGLRLSCVFRISNYVDYRGEPTVLYTDWTGQECEYTVVRTYRSGDAIELTCAERV